MCPSYMYLRNSKSVVTNVRIFQTENFLRKSMQKTHTNWTYMYNKTVIILGIGPSHLFISETNKGLEDQICEKQDIS